MGRIWPARQRLPARELDQAMQQWGDLGGSKGGTDREGWNSSGTLKEELWISCGNEDGGKRPKGRPKLRWKDIFRRDLKAWNIRKEWATDREICKGIDRQDRLPRTGRRR